jgi:hypothetical protein
MASIPLPGPLPDIPLPGVPSLNPFEHFFDFVDDKLQDLREEVLNTLERLIISPLVEVGSKLEAYLYGNALGVSGLLVSAVTFIVIMLAAFRRKYVVNVLHAFIMAAVVGLAGHVWFQIAAWAQALGRDSSRSVIAFFEGAPTGGGGSNLFGNLPEINNILGSIFATGATLFFGAPLVLIFMIYAVASVMVTFLMLPALAMSPLGERSQKWLNVLISIGIVAMTIGGPAAILCLELGNFMAKNANIDNNWIISSFWTVIGIVAAIGIQIVLLIVTYKTWQRVSGQVGASVRGSVEASIRNDRARARSHDAHANAMRPLPVEVVIAKPSRSTQIKNEVVKQGALAISARAAGSSTPVTAAIVHVAGQKIASRKTPPIKETK